MTEIKKAAMPTGANKAVAKQSKAPNMKDFVAMMMPEVRKVLPATITAERFTRITLNALSNNPKLMECSPKSFLGSMMSAAQAGLEPNTPLGEAYLLPYRNHGQMECQYQIGYKGLLTLAHRAGTNAEARVVYENDEFSYEYGLNPKLVHVPALKDRGEIVAFYAVWRNGETWGFEVWSVEDVKKHAQKFSKSYGSGPWQTNFTEMGKKTVLKAALKYAPLSVEVMKQISNDETVKTELAEDMSESANEINYAEIMEADVSEVNADAETGEVAE